MVNLSKEVQYIKTVGPSRAELLNKLGIFTLKDLITYFPREYEDRGKVKRKEFSSFTFPFSLSLILNL